MEGAISSTTSSSLKRVREDEDQKQQVEMMKRQKSYTQIQSILDEEEEEPNQDISSLITTLQQELSSSSTSSSSSPSPSPSPSEENPKPHLVGEYRFDEQSKLTPTTLNSCSSFDASFVGFGDDGEGESNKERVIRHLLEASDDELGIPTERSDGEIVRVVGGGDDDGYDCYNGGGGGVELSFCDGLWEFEDETANYYALLQSQLFM
ncbi:hypothetical protein Sjap_015725 [Stephania japonica]|uniref:Uncharacterized protein n=1 Tax=Stephania japonica TaxID=461633 RepID=A0AAP0IKS1_9MAGN